MTRFAPEQYWLDQTREHLVTAEKTFKDLAEPFNLWLEACATCIDQGGKIMFFGNGGSAADAQHLATELTVRFINNRRAIAALALTTDTSALTAIGNDLGFERIFIRQIEALGKPGDMVVGISTSGKSANILQALEFARTLQITTVGLSGQAGDKMKRLCDIFLAVPSETTARIQEMHITLGQILCGALEQKLGLTNL